MSDVPLLVDPTVSRVKFDREVAAYRALEDSYIRRGWWLVKASFPEVFVVFGTPEVKPPTVVFGALLDFTNYDLWPPSVRLVDPFTRVPYLLRTLPTQLIRRIPASTPPELAAQGVVLPPQQQLLMQAHLPDEIPFLCLPGVREYHDHPAHTGDSWLLHRGRGEGTLYFVLDQLSRYGVDPIKGYKIGMQFAIVGFQSEAPA